MLIRNVKNYSDGIGMEFGIENCKWLLIHRGKPVATSEINIMKIKTIRPLTALHRYKYLEVLECDWIKQEEMKGKMK